MRETYELRVGFFVLGAAILLVGGWGWLKGLSILTPPQLFWVRFHDVAGLSNNATINVQGVRVGSVDNITFKLPDGFTDIPDSSPDLAKLPKVYAHMKLTGIHFPIPKNADITIQTLGMVGAKYIEITLPELGSSSDALDPQVVVEGKDPVRVELVINNMAKKLNQAADTISSDEAAQAVKHISQASAKLDKNMDSMPALTASMKRAADSIEATGRRFSRTADKSEAVADSANRFFTQGRSSMESVGTLASGMTQTNKRIGKILDNPAFSRDLKDTVDLAHKTAISVQAAMSEFSGTVKDKDLRADLLSMLGKLQTSSDDIRNSMQVVNKLADDQGLRSDMKTVMEDAKNAMSKANTMFADPSFRTDLTQTMSRVKTAATDVDEAARQLHQILGKRAPLWQMMVGRPGKEQTEKTRETLHDGTKVNANRDLSGSSPK